MIVIVDFGVGNLGSIRNMFAKAGVSSTVSADPAAIGAATKLVLPGVGAFDTAMNNLRERGLVDVLSERVAAGTPTLGLCLGMQLFARRSEEGKEPGFGWLDAETMRLRPAASAGLRVPHMGWNTLHAKRSHPLFEGLGDQARFYFVHSYHVVCRDERDVLAETPYGDPITSVVARGNLVGVQCHPEKSHRWGTTLLRNFAERM